MTTRSVTKRDLRRMSTIGMTGMFLAAISGAFYLAAKPLVAVGDHFRKMALGQHEKLREYMRQFPELDGVKFQEGLK